MLKGQTLPEEMLAAKYCHGSDKPDTPGIVSFRSTEAGARRTDLQSAASFQVKI
jgi:hypothetical protein